MRIAISGSMGLIGSVLISALETEGHSIVPIICSGRKPPPGAVWLGPYSAGHVVHLPELEGMDAIVHLAGENLARGRWTPNKKRAVFHSRSLVTLRLCKALNMLQSPPGALLIASAVGVYDDRGGTELDEDSTCKLPLTSDGSFPSGASFLSYVCMLWEAAAKAEPVPCRVVNLRFGAVLSGKGGALAKMLKPFKWGLGGVIGSGEQYMSWIAIDDVVGAIKHVLAREALQGPVNVVSPNPVTNREFTKTLGKLLRRPTLFPVPAFAVRFAFGELADALLLASQRVVPRRLMDSGFAFKYPVLEDALRHVLGLE